METDVFAPLRTPQGCIKQNPRIRFWMFAGVSILPGVTELCEHGIVGLVYIIHTVILNSGVRISYEEARLRAYFIAIEELRGKIP